MAGGSEAKTNRTIASGAVNAVRVADAAMAANEPPALTSKPFNQGLMGGLWPRTNPANRYRSAVTIKNARRSVPREDKAIIAISRQRARSPVITVSKADLT
jgi:hypothetical protein